MADDDYGMLEDILKDEEIEEKPTDAKAETTAEGETAEPEEEPVAAQATETTAGTSSSTEAAPSTTIPTQSKDTRYFIIKSFSAENVTTSLRKGVWATQARNENAFNSAFNNSSRVVMIFSINGSRHFQGYAKMTSAIQPRSSHNTAKEFGWGDRWGTSFHLQWERVGSIPFSAVDGLTNPYDDNSPIIRSRDGVEVPRSVGDRLCSLIDQVSVPITQDLEFPLTDKERSAIHGNMNKSAGPARGGGGYHGGPLRGLSMPREYGGDRFHPYRGNQPPLRGGGRSMRPGTGIPSYGGDHGPSRHHPRAPPMTHHQYPVMGHPQQSMPVVLEHPQAQVPLQQVQQAPVQPTMVDSAVDITRMSYEEYLQMRQSLAAQAAPAAQPQVYQPAATEGETVYYQAVYTPT